MSATTTAAPAALTTTSDPLDGRTGPACSESNCYRVAVKAETRCPDHARWSDDHGRDLPQALADLLRDGVAEDRSGAAWRVILSARQRGWGTARVERELTSSRNQLSHWLTHRRDSKTATGWRPRSETQQRRLLERTIRNADAWIVEHGVARSKAERLQALGEIEMLARSVVWRGRAADGEQRVLLAILARQQRVGHLSSNLSVRDIALMTQLSPETSARVLRRLQSAGWLKIERQGRNSASRITVQTPSREQQSALIWREGDEPMSSHDVQELTHEVYGGRAGLGTTAARVRSVLVAHPEGVTRRRLADLTGLSRGSVINALTRLVEMGAVTTATHGSSPTGVRTVCVRCDEPEARAEVIKVGLDTAWLAVGETQELLGRLDERRERRRQQSPSQRRLALQARVIEDRANRAGQLDEHRRERAQQRLHDQLTKTLAEAEDRGVPWVAMELEEGTVTGVLNAETGEELTVSAVRWATRSWWDAASDPWPRKRR